MPKRLITRTHILEYMAALYAENPSRPNLQEFLSNPENYANFISTIFFSDRDSHMYPEKFLENPKYHLIPEVAELFSTLKTFPPQQFNELLARQGLDALQKNLSASADALYTIEEPERLDGRPVKIDGRNYSRNTDSLRIRDFGDGWNNIPSSTYIAFFNMYDSYEVSKLQHAVTDTSLIVTGTQQQRAFFDINAHPDGKANVAIFPPSEQYSLDWEKRGDRTYVNVAAEGKAAQWIELEMGADQRKGKLLSPNRTPWAVTLSAEIKEGTPIDLTVNTVQEVSFLPYKDPNLFSAVAQDKQRLIATLASIDTALGQFAEQNRAAILADQYRQDQLRQKRYEALIENFGSAFNDYVPDEKQKEAYDRLFKDIPEQRRLFDLMEQTYTMLRKQIAPITDPADRERVLNDVINRYFDPASKDYLLKEERPDIQEKIGKIIDILKTYKTVPALADKSIDEVLHQLDWELKDRLIPSENREYRMPLNGSRCPACDGRLKDTIDELLRNRGLIGNAEPVKKLAVTEACHIEGPTTTAASSVQPSTPGGVG